MTIDNVPSGEVLRRAKPLKDAILRLVGKDPDDLLAIVEMADACSCNPDEKELAIWKVYPILEDIDVMYDLYNDHKMIMLWLSETPKQEINSTLDLTRLAPMPPVAMAWYSITKIIKAAKMERKAIIFRHKHTKTTNASV